MNILDYIRQRGDLSFKADPFNEVDNLVFSQLIYAGFGGSIENNERIKIQDLAKRYFSSPDNNGKHGKSFSRDGLLVLDAIKDTERYKDCVIHNFVSLLHEDTTEQFEACMIDLPDKTTVICFKGTDDSLIGWKEDCYLSYKSIASQDDSVRYLNQHCNIFRKYRILGHSKGGHLAIYSAMHCNPFIRSRIIEVVSNDGPGLRPGSFDEKEFNKIKDRYELIVPEKDGVGTIFEMAKNKTIAKVSTKNIVEAHSMMSWQIDANRIKKAEGDSYQTDKTRIALVNFLNESSPEQKEIFTEEIFKAFNEAGITTVSQLARGGMPVIFRVIKELAEMDSVARSIALNLAKTFSISVSSGLGFSKAVEEKRENLKAKAKNIEISLASKLIDSYLKEMKEKEEQ